MEVPIYPFLLSLLLFSLPLYTISQSQFLSDDSSALFTFKSAVGSRTRSLDSWTSTNYPCTAWIGITCNSTYTGPRVFELRLPGTALSGTIPPSTLSQLTSLTAISLRFNVLTSPIPDDLSNLKNLTGLYLNNNKFTGPIPSSILTLYSLQRLDLSSNQFSGQVPISLNNLTELKTLYLQYNNLSGEMPQDLNLPNLVQFNISYNNLTGPIPPSLRKFPASAFLGMKMCGGPLGPCANETPPSSSPPSSPFGPALAPFSENKKKKLSAGAIAGIAVAAAVFLALLLIILFVFLYRKRDQETQQQKHEVRDTSIPQDETETNNTVPGPVVQSQKETMPSVPVIPVPTGRKLVSFRKGMGVKFGLDELLRASAEVLGKGTFGTTYKAILESGEVVAVKRLKEVNVPEKEFREKVAKVGELEHMSIVPLLSYYYSKDEKLLVYDFMTMGSLSAILHGTRASGTTPLNWETRAKITLAVSQGITHIHSAGPTSSHGNIKSSNVLLTTKYEARLSDHGLYTLANPQTPFTRVTGNRAPEVTDPKKISHKADVYSFGVLVLELLTGKAPAHPVLNEDGGVDLPRWVNSVVNEEWKGEVFDMDLVRYQSPGDDMMQLLQVALNCTEQHPDSRPNMTEVVARIEEIVKNIERERDGSGESTDETRRSPI